MLALSTAPDVSARLVNGLASRICARALEWDIPHAAGRLAGASQDIARKLAHGGRLLTFGLGLAAADAQHVAVEFVHPVIVGKRAYAARSLSGHPTARPEQALQAGLSHADARDALLVLHRGPFTPDVLSALDDASSRGLLTVLLADAHLPTSVAARCSHALAVPTRDPLIAREVHTTLHHLLWETVQVFSETAGLASDPADDGRPPVLDALYPFLYGEEPDPDGARASAEASITAKLLEAGLLRSALEASTWDVARCARAIAHRLARGGCLYTVANGGSATDAAAVAHLISHPVRGHALPAVSLVHDTAALTAISNDVGYDHALARILAALARPDDILLAISTSGSSANLLAALDQAKRSGLLTVGLAGYDGGRMRDLAPDHLLVVPSSSVHRIQEVQTTLYHLLWEAVDLVFERGGEEHAEHNRAAGQAARGRAEKDPRSLD